MSKLDPKPDRPNSFRAQLDSATKILAIVLAFIGGAKYFYDKSEALAASRAEKSISYIETYAAAELLIGRQAAYDFWIDQEQLVGVLRKEELSARNYHMLLRQSVFRRNADEAVRRPLLIFDNFYTQIEFCRSSKLCDEKLLDEYFCRNAQRDALAYAPFYERLTLITGDSSLGDGLAKYARSCTEP